MEFEEFAQLVNKQFNMMSEHTLYIVNAGKETVWNTYLDSFNPEDNRIYRERREFDCVCCAMFIKRIGNVVAIIDDEIVSVWDVPAEGKFKQVSNSLSTLVKSKDIRTIFLHEESKFGKQFTIEALNGHKWNHFWCEVPARFISEDYRTKRASIESTRNVFKSGLENISTETINLALELIDSTDEDGKEIVYRGQEFRSRICEFDILATEYAHCPEEDIEMWLWNNYSRAGARIKNDAIGTFLIDLGKETIEDAVNKFGKIMDPTNYKQTKSIATKKQKEDAFKDIVELGYESALQRRHATLEDINVNDVLYADRSSAKHMKGSLSELLLSDNDIASESKQIVDISFDDFMSNVVPKATSLELLFKNSQQSQLVSLVAPMDSESKNMLSWDNNFSWSYKGDIADSSMKENVKALGGKTEGALRFSIQWNEKNDNRDDLDAHCQNPNEHIYYQNKRTIHPSSGMLDVDIQEPGSMVAVENIIYSDISKMPDGDYKFYVNNYSRNGGTGGFTAEIEFDGQIHSFEYPQVVTQDVIVAVVTLKNGVFSIEPYLESSIQSKEVFNIDSEKFHKIQSIMLSPNFWNGQSKGNKHYFFMLENCKQPDSIRGIYNEFLHSDLRPHRKTFDFLASKFRCPYSEDQLTGLGFSKHGQEAVIRVSGKRQYKIKF